MNCPRSDAQSTGSAYSKFFQKMPNKNEQRNDFGSCGSEPFVSTSAGRFFNGFFDEAMRFFDYPLSNIAPQWMEQTVMRNWNDAITVCTFFISHDLHIGFSN